MNDLFLNISNISAGYGSGVVIEGISFSVKEGETFGLVGLNGVGKTTLIKTVIGLRDPLSGTIAINGMIAGSHGAKRALAYLPERFDPPWFLTAYEFISFTLSLYGAVLNKGDADLMAESLGLKKENLSRKAQTYSKGMRQKLGLLATFLTPCPLLILDEPMSGLDPLARAQVKAIIARAQEQGRTIFLSSHILSDVKQLCHRVAVLHGGKIVFTGSPETLTKQTGEEDMEQAFLSCIHSIPCAA